MLIGGKFADALRAPAHLPRRASSSSRSPRSRCGLADVGGAADRGARRCKASGRPDEPGDALDHRRDLPAASAGTAIGIWAGVSALALAIGPLVGGLITEHLGWNWIFFVNVPVGHRSGSLRASLVHRRVEGRDARAARPPGPRHVGCRPLRAHLRADRGEQRTAGPRRGSWARFVVARRLARRLRPARAHQRAADARRSSSSATATYTGANTRRPPRRARDVRRLLLRLALHAEHPRLLGRAGRSRVPPDDGAHHPASRRSRAGRRIGSARAG